LEVLRRKPPCSLMKWSRKTKPSARRNRGTSGKGLKESHNARN
jgi:hypothetical protein